MHLFKNLRSALIALSIAGMAQAGVIAPAGLNDGDQFRLIFVSSTTRDASVRDSSVYDQFVSSLANAAGLNTYGAQSVSWTALVSVYDNVAVNASDRLANSDVPLYTVSGLLVANSANQIWGGSLLSPINVTEGGATLTSPANPKVFTGTTSNGSAAQCLDLGNGCTGYVEYGLLTATNSNWVAAGDLMAIDTDSGEPTGAQGRIYGYSSILTVTASQEAPAVPEPSTWLMMGPAVAGVFFFRRQRKA